MTPQHAAAPETETDANGLTEAEQTMLWEAIERAFLDTTAWSREVEDEIDRTVERIVAERVRVVEGERDAEVAEAEREHEKTLAIMEAACDRADAATARAESAEAAHEAEKAAHGKVWSLLGEYFDFDADPWDDHDAACPAPEDLWRLHRDLRSLLGGGGAR